MFETINYDLVALLGLFMMTAPIMGLGFLSLYLDDNPDSWLAKKLEGN